MRLVVTGYPKDFGGNLRGRYPRESGGTGPPCMTQVIALRAMVVVVAAPVLPWVPCGTDVIASHAWACGNDEAPMLSRVASKRRMAPMLSWALRGDCEGPMRLTPDGIGGQRFPRVSALRKQIVLKLRLGNGILESACGGIGVDSP